jgi:Trypsin-co-occurring domain 1
MSNYIQFDSEDGDGIPVLIEVEETEIDADEGGTSKVGIRDWATNSVAIAQKPFKLVMKAVIKQNVQGMIEAVRVLPDPPSEIEITFGLKATGEAGNIAVGKAGTEANYNVKLTWKNSTNGKPS